MKEALAAEDIDIIIDLRELIQAIRQGMMFFGINVQITCLKVLLFLTDDMVISVLWPRLCLFVNLQQVKQKGTTVTPILSESWVRLNFSPRNPRVKASHYYTGYLKVKHMIQKM